MRRAVPIVPFLALLVPVPAAADGVLYVLDQSQVPFDLGPGSRVNSPANVQNAPSQFANSAGNHANAAGVPGNAPSNPANGPGGPNAVYTPDGEYAGYALQAGGALNLFSADGRRVAYQPAGGHTKSLFSAQGQWCGTVSRHPAGGYAFGMTLECARRVFD